MLVVPAKLIRTGEDHLFPDPLLELVTLPQVLVEALRLLQVVTPLSARRLETGHLLLQVSLANRKVTFYMKS